MCSLHILLILALFFPIIHCCLDRGDREFSPSMKASVVSEIHKQVPSDCIFVLYSPEYLSNGRLAAWRRLWRQLRCLHDLLVATGVAPLSEQARCPTGRAVAVAHRLSLADIHQVSGVRWIVFAEAESAADSTLSSAPPDSDVAVVQYTGGAALEVWRYRGSWPRTLLGRWADGSWHARPAPPSGYRLAGMRITVAVVAIPTNSSEYNIKRPPGYEFWRVLAEVSNITYDLVVPADGGFGREVGGRWGGVVGLLQAGGADVAAEMLAFSSERAQVMRYTLPLYADRQTLFVRRQQVLRPEWRVFAAPLSPRLWAVLALTMLISTLSLGAVLAARGRGAAAVASDALLYSACVFFVEGSPVAGGGGPPLRLWQVSTAAAALVAHAAFCGALVATVAAPSQAPPFRGLQGLLRSAHFSLVVEANTSIHHYFQTSQAAAVRGLYDRWLRPESSAAAGGRLQPSLEAGFSSLCRRAHAAFMGMRSLYVRVAPRLPCALVEVPGAASTVLYGFGVRRGFPYRDILNRNLLRMRQSGVMSRLSQRAAPPLPVEQPPAFQGVPVLRLVLPLAALAVGQAAAAAALLLELRARRQPTAVPSTRRSPTHLPFLN